MQKKQFVEERPISPVLEVDNYKERSAEFLNDEEHSTLEMFNQLIIGSNKLAANEKSHSRDYENGAHKQESETTSNAGGEDETSIVGGPTAQSKADEARRAGSSVASEENKENKDPSDRKTGKVSSEAVLVQEGATRGRPSSCVFVASLSSNKTDDELCVSVTKHFKQWGKLSTVKVLRDPSNRPYAFVQYTNDQDSRLAIAKGHNSILDGRSLRCEAAKVNRTLFISSKFVKNERSFKDALEEFGEIEQLAASDEFGNVKQGKVPNKTSKYWFCKYVYRDDAIRAFANLSESPSLHIEWTQNIESHGNFSSDSKIKFDKFSIFVGQLSQSVTEEELIDRFKRHGDIVEVTIVKKPSNTFGFIKYKDESSAAGAVERENHSMFKDKTMHVQYREVHSGAPKNVSKNYGIALAPPPINLKKKNSPATKKPSDVRKVSPFNHQLYPMPMPIPVPTGKKGISGYPSNNFNKSKVSSNATTHVPGRRKVSKYNEVYDKFKPDAKEESPTPPESVQTYDSHTFARSGYSPSSAVNSERSDYFNNTIGKGQKGSVGKNKSIPYFYYIPTNEVAPASNSSGKYTQPTYYNPYQYYIPFEPTSEFQNPSSYGIPFPMYYPPGPEQEFAFEESREPPT
ncbi:Piso0_000494 [Millerozyma farinosa CBS 7064]|uniref:Piso0_000494 protein n=1 Tax=Pichia sorbitophila (strain ATCC MYA-4447 / BCRC 22081 / CBS 7064 / NBRC 10061 / NRRL Y-12695) TaxID=559304 RepID=G8YVK9_PICSO|nr:Piso0_000494 [Millerozyma farinosa CBS 7064]CCE73453.1 Piso0_000494 [Millerozyma farinosa CBS 7064]